MTDALTAAFGPPYEGLDPQIVARLHREYRADKKKKKSFVVQALIPAETEIEPAQTKTADDAAATEVVTTT